MLLIQLTGLSGAGKSTIANGVKVELQNKGLHVEVIDADIYRKQVCSDLGFSKVDRNENLRRLGFIANHFAMNGTTSILAAINPYEEIRKELSQYGPHVRTIGIYCDLDTLITRDSKLPYKKAMLPDHHPDKISNLTGVNDPHEIARNPGLIINTTSERKEKVLKRWPISLLKKQQIN